MAKVVLREEIGITAEQMFGQAFLYGVEKRPLYRMNPQTKRNELVEGEYSGITVRFFSEKQVGEYAIDFSFYKYGTEELAIPLDNKVALLKFADAMIKPMTPIKFVGFVATVGTETNVSRRFDGDEVKYNDRTTGVYNIVASMVEVAGGKQ